LSRATFTRDAICEAALDSHCGRHPRLCGHPLRNIAFILPSLLCVRPNKRRVDGAQQIRRLAMIVLITDGE